VLVPNRSVQSRVIQLMRSPMAVDSAIILASVAGFLSLIAGLGALGLGVGFDIPPLGEDYNWIDILQRGHGTDAARLFWSIDYRNPLSPWWYIAARQLIVNIDAGLLALRYGVTVLLAFSSYLLVITVAARGARAFALALALLVSVWMANRFPDQIIWNFQGALAASMLSVATYARFVTDPRRPYYLYALSLVLWFVAFATYTIQCGAVLAVGYLALRRGSPSPRKNRIGSVVDRLGSTLFDTAPYLALFGLFVLIWQTTMGPLADSMPLTFRVAAFMRSVREGIWNGDLEIFYDWVRSSPNRWAFIAAAAGYGAALCLALQLRNVRQGYKVPGVSWSTLIDLMIVVACFAVPTVVLESSSAVWAPGTRWPMVYQLTTPALVLGVIAALVLGMRSTWRSWLWNGALALAVAIGVLFSLGHNWYQSAIATNETFIRDSVQRLVAEDVASGRKPKQVLLMLDEPNRRFWRSADVLSPTIARVWLPGIDTSFRLAPWAAPSDIGWQSWWRIRFGPDSEGIGNAKVWGGTVPYEEIAILYVSGRTARRVTHLDRTDLAGFDIEWARDKPVSLSGATGRAVSPGLGGRP
jgi:hypothetical protein